MLHLHGRGFGSRRCEIASGTALGLESVFVVPMTLRVLQKRIALGIALRVCVVSVVRSSCFTAFSVLCAWLCPTQLGLRSFAIVRKALPAAGDVDEVFVSCLRAGHRWCSFVMVACRVVLSLRVFSLLSPFW